MKLQVVNEDCYTAGKCSKLCGRRFYFPPHIFLKPTHPLVSRASLHFGHTVDAQT